MKRKKYTGERLETHEQGEGMIEHLHRYAIAMERCKGKTVLDIASGEGYGSNLLAAEAYLLLIYCLLYYLSKLRAEDSDVSRGADFWVVTGLSIYVVVNFFVFLFYVPMIKFDSNLAERIWDVHNIAYIILCILITRAFYESA